MDKFTLFLNKFCKLEKRDGFILNGWVRGITAQGVIFETTQLSSFIAWDEIIELRPLKEGQR